MVARRVSNAQQSFCAPTSFCPPKPQIPRRLGRWTCNDVDRNRHNDCGRAIGQAFPLHPLPVPDPAQFHDLALLRSPHLRGCLPGPVCVVSPAAGLAPVRDHADELVRGIGKALAVGTVRSVLLAMGAGQRPPPATQNCHHLREGAGAARRSFETNLPPMIRPGLSTNSIVATSFPYAAETAANAPSRRGCL